jgi:dihydroxyacetone kinase-like protein
MTHETIQSKAFSKRGVHPIHPHSHAICCNTLCSTSGQVFIFDIGSTIGGLIGRAFQRAAKSFQGKREMNVQDLVTLLEIILGTIKEAGGTAPGDKTLVDALEPAVDAAKQAVKSDKTNVYGALEIAASAAERGAKHTVNMVAKVGRASYLGERSRGTIDPGTMFIYMFLDALSQALPG